MIYSTSVTMWGSDKTTNNAQRHEVQRKRETGSWPVQAANCRLKAEILFHCCGVCTVSTDGDGLIAPFNACFHVRAWERTRLHASRRFLFNHPEGEEGDKCTVIPVKPNKIRPNVVMQPYGRKCHLTEGRGGEKCVKRVYVWGGWLSSAAQRREPYRLKKMC